VKGSRGGAAIHPTETSTHPNARTWAVAFVPLLCATVLLISQSSPPIRAATQAFAQVSAQTTGITIDYPQDGSIFPPEIRSIPARQRKSVVLPDPDGPSKTKKSPWSISMEKSSSALLPPG